jgi:hypothetical protein
VNVRGHTRRNILAGLIGSTAAGAQVASAQASDKGLINNVLVIGYDYQDVKNETQSFEDVPLASAAVHVSNQFLRIEATSKARGRAVENRVSIVSNFEGRVLPVEGVSAPAARTTIDAFCGSDLKGTNVILYFVGHGFVGTDGIEMVHPDGTSTPVWALLRRIGKEAATRVAIIDCCRVQGAEVTADLVSEEGEAVAFIFSAPPRTQAIADVPFYGTTFTKVFLEHLDDEVELSTLFLQVRQDPQIRAAQEGRKVDPILYTSLSRPVWLAGAPPAYGYGTSLPLFFPG